MHVLTAAVITVTVLGTVVVAGLVVERLLSGGRPSSEADWVDAPFLGIASIVIVLQNGVYSGLPIRITAFPLVIVIVLGLAILLRRSALSDLLRACPLDTVLVALGVCALHSFGMWGVGAEAYLGRGWGDQINYSALAHYLTEYVYGSTPASHQPAALLGAANAQVRIGQSVLLAFFSTLTGFSPKVLFEPVILLAPPLLTLAVAEHGRQAGLPRWLLLGLAAFAGCLPAVASVHLESFLSQALAIPALVYLPILLARACESTRLGDYLRAGMVFAVASAIYLEYFPILTACAVTFAVGCASVKRRALTAHVTGLTLVLALPVLLQATRRLASVMNYTFGPVVAQGLAHIYPWALTVEGLARLWAGDLVGQAIDARDVATRALALGLVGLGYLGLMRQVSVEMRTLATSRLRLPHVARSLSTLGLATVPLAILIWDGSYAYHFYKALLLAAPLLAWGIGYVVWLEFSWMSLRFRRLIVALPLAALAALAVAATWDMVHASTNQRLPEAEVLRRRHIGNPVTMDPGFLAFEAKLESLSGQDMVLCVSDRVWSRGHVNGWFALAARRNRVWALNPHLNDRLLSKLSHGRYLDHVPDNTRKPVFVVTPDRGLLWPLGTDISNLTTKLRLKSFHLFESGSDPVAFLCHPWMLPLPDGWGTISIGPAFEPIVAYSSAAQRATLFIRFGTGAYEQGVVRVSLDGQPTPVHADASGAVAAPIELKAGATSIALARNEHAPAAVEATVSLLLARDGPQIGSIENKNGLEVVDGKPFFWIGQGTTKIEILAPSPGDYVVELETRLGPSVSKRAHRRLRIQSGAGAPLAVVTDGGSVILRVAVPHGRAQISIDALDEPDTILPHDSRPLILGVEKVSVRPWRG